MRLSLATPAFLVAATLVAAANPDPDSCPGYKATNVIQRGNTLTASLELAGKPCNVYGPDIEKLSLSVTYETANRIHLKITDPSTRRYEIPPSVLPRPGPSEPPQDPQKANIKFTYTSSPFTFSIIRPSSPTTPLFQTTPTHPLIFAPQYIRLLTTLPTNPNIYGLGEHTNPFRLPPHNTTLTLWSRDAYGVPNGTNLYGNHPVYFEHRVGGTHGVFLANSNGMDVKLRGGEGEGGQTLEYNIIGGIVDMYFLAGSRTDPVEVARQYAQVVGFPAEVPYWSLGFHQCRFGYADFVEVADVITSYADAGIPLETMWTDIDYMDRRRIFTLDPVYFPLPRMREIVDYLHSKGQKYILMTDPAVGVIPGYEPYDHGSSLGIWIKAANGSDALGLVWPGVTVFPDWFNPSAQQYWNEEFEAFYNPETGVDIDGAWIDMNEPSSFCDLPCDDPWAQAVEQNLPPPRTAPPPDPDTPIFQNNTSTTTRRWARRDLLDPPYKINNAAGPLSSKTIFTDSLTYTNQTLYDTHNLYGTLMSLATRTAMLARRPALRPLVITRSTFAGAGKHVGKWLGDNVSSWWHYGRSVAGMLGFAGVYQVPMVGSDVCGYAGNTTETLCARWAMLGAFYPFYRNHNSDTSISQEFYRWPMVAQAAKNAIDIRYRLMDYIYTAFHQAHIDGTPILNPLWFLYPTDTNTFPIDLQFFYGPSILVAPVTAENATSVSIYLPNDVFYDFETLAPVQGAGAYVQLDNVGFDQIPVFIKGGSVVPMRVQSAMTTEELRMVDFEFVVASGRDGEAQGRLFVDDGVSVDIGDQETEVVMRFGEGRLDVWGTFGYGVGVNVRRVRFLGVCESPGGVVLVREGGVEVEVGRTGGSGAAAGGWSYGPETQVLDVPLGIDFTEGFSVVFW